MPESLDRGADANVPGTSETLTVLSIWRVEGRSGRSDEQPPPLHVSDPSI